MFRVEENKIIYEEDHEEKGFVQFQYLNPKTVDIIHTFVNPIYRGKGIAQKIIEYSLEYFTQKGINVKYSCSYVKKYLEEK